jgi:hypothetical protein
VCVCLRGGVCARVSACVSVFAGVSACVSVFADVCVYVFRKDKYNWTTGYNTTTIQNKIKCILAKSDNLPQDLYKSLDLQACQ